MFGYMFDVGYQTVFIYCGNVSCFFQDAQGFEDELREQFEGLSKNAAHHLFAVDIENILELFI